MGFGSLIRDLRDRLLEQHDGKCGYCGCAIQPVAFPVLEHFYPKSRYPEKVADPENILLVCPVCNTLKADKFPLDEHDQPLLLNPNVDDFTDHLEFSEEGTVKGLTPRGEATIELLQLNREPLVEQRKLERLERTFLTRSREVSEDPFAIFESHLTRIQNLSTLTPADDQDTQYLANLLYSNVITALETYLSDQLIRLCTNSKKYLRAFTESFLDFREYKFDLCQLFEKHDKIDGIAVDAMRGVMFHNLPKVAGIYESTFNIDFPQFGTLARTVNIRHDLVHRNGKSKEGVTHRIQIDDVLNLVEDARTFVTEVNTKLAIAK
ncbi:HNH endonuclease [uncultured Rubinisphaera sp.]|uniref:HNH endonuclease n=1 Tax=uncultured Rubinisphaera sp. TaxID=1678686 RepID=UPI0030DDBA9F|tara:strand:+ start:60 stop:1025 length:966 start_codon:yes stop_codon:yes gene_type:complete